MKTLYLLRHAKSSRNIIDITDFDRPLNEKGYSDAHSMSSRLKKMHVFIDEIIVSPAIRTFSTACIFAKELHFPLDELKIRKQLYDADITDYLSCISESGKANSILLVGHNPTITETAQELSSKDVKELKTCGLICIKFEISSWKNIYNLKGNPIFEMDPGLQ